MGNDFAARKQRRKARHGEEESIRRVRKKKNQPRRLCRGAIDLVIIQCNNGVC